MISVFAANIVRPQKQDIFVYIAKKLHIIAKIRTCRSKKQHKLLCSSYFSLFSDNVNTARDRSLLKCGAMRLYGHLSERLQAIMTSRYGQTPMRDSFILTRRLRCEIVIQSAE